jgi:ribulose-phosphate 3-epimerase
MDMKNDTISASILSADFSHLADQIKEAEQAGVDWIHLDVMDGHYVPNISMGPFIVETCNRITSLPLDVHLMIEEPEKYLSAFARAGADNITVHVETCPHLNSTLDSIHNLGCKAGVAMNPSTPVEAILEVAYLLDLVLVMTVNPGYSGQSFIPQTLGKVKKVRQLLDELNPAAVIEVDGGINNRTICQAKEAGAGVFVTATAVFANPLGISGGVKELRGLLTAR